MSRDEYLAGVGVLGELGVDADIRLDHLRISPTAAFGDSRWYGVRDGSAFSIPVVFVYAHDGRAIKDWEFFDADQIEAATARFERLSAPLPGPGMSTAATRAVAQLRDRRREYRVIATRGERLALARACARGENSDGTRPSHGSLPALAGEIQEGARNSRCSCSRSTIAATAWQSRPLRATIWTRPMRRSMRATAPVKLPTNGALR